MIEEKGKVGVLVVDMQKGYFEGDRNYKSFQDRVIQFVNKAKEKDFSFWYTRQGGNGDIICPMDIPNLSIIDKFGPSAFHYTNLELQLRKENILTLVVSGVDATQCVWATIIDAVEKMRGLNLVTSPGLIENIFYPKCSNYLDNYSERGVKIFPSSEDVLKYCLSK